MIMTTITITIITTVMTTVAMTVIETIGKPKNTARQPLAVFF
jgi:hypothetical protein